MTEQEEGFSHFHRGRSVCCAVVVVSGQSTGGRKLGLQLKRKIRNMYLNWRHFGAVTTRFGFALDDVVDDGRQAKNEQIGDSHKN